MNKEVDPAKIAKSCDYSKNTIDGMATLIKTERTRPFTEELSVKLDGKLLLY